MIDLHCHVLPGIDDGPDTMERSLALARRAAETGTTTIVATPHVSARYPNDAARIAGGVEQLERLLAQERAPIEIRRGAEVAAAHAPAIDAEELLRLQLGDGPYLLLEPPFAPIAAGFDTIALDLMRAGHRIVIAHPERCAAFHRDERSLRALLGAGALSSITAGSLSGRFGGEVRRFALRLAREELVHNVASDAHDELQRPPGMVAEIERAGLSHLREWLTELVPAAILAGEPMPRRPARSRAPRRRTLAGLFRR